jgi:hypothetical protein
MSGFQDVRMRLVFSPGDLLLHQPSERYRSAFYRVVWKLYPRWMVRRLAKHWGLFLLITGVKA